MRAELRNGVSGAHKIHAQLEKVHKREQELREWNAILQGVIQAADGKDGKKNVSRRGGGGNTLLLRPSTVDHECPSRWSAQLQLASAVAAAADLLFFVISCMYRHSAS